MATKESTAQNWKRPDEVGFGVNYILAIFLIIL